MSVLDDVLAEGDMEEMSQALGDVTFNEALNLRHSTRMRLTNVDPSPRRAASRPVRPASPAPAARSLPRTPSPQPMGTLKRNLTLAKLIPEFDLGPWESAMIPDRLPTLPLILDPTLEAGAFIHHGYASGSVTDLSYERLEWIGDAYIYLLSSILISKTFPSLLPGKCSQLRERLVKNLTLSHYARQYGFEERAKLPASFSEGSFRASKDQDKTKVLGDIFEAYVAAVVLSDPAEGVTRVSAWLKDLWGMTIKKEILEEEKHGLKIDSPMWNLRGNSGLDRPVATLSAPNYKERLHRLLGSKGVKLEYKDAAPVKKDTETKLALFTVGVYLTGWGVKDRLLGTGTAYGKKDAGMKAAAMALENRKAMDMFLEKKRVFDAQLELERQALANS